MMTFRKLASIALTLCLCTFVRAQGATQIGDIEFSDSISIDENTIPLRGAKKLEWWGFDVYTAGFYVGDESKTPDEILDASTPRYLEIHYHRSIKAKDIIKATKENLSENPTVDMAKVQDQLEDLYECFENVGEGDIYSISYSPESGTTISLNDEESCRFEGGEFARVFFGIWLSEYPINDDLAEALRGED